MSWELLRIYPDPILRQHSKEVKEISDEIREVIENLSNIGRSQRAVGCSAVQLGSLLRIFVVCIDEWLPNEQVVPGKLKVYINPTLSDPATETAVVDEGCLSLPEIHVPMERPRGITIEAMDENGNFFKEELEDFPARVVMHENDHLNAVLTIDRLSKKVRMDFEPQLRELRKEFKAK